MATYKSQYTGAQIDQAIGAALTPDTSLSQAGKTADAKAAGDAVSELKNEITSEENKSIQGIEYFITWTSGGGIYKDGTVVSVNSWGYSEKIPVNEGDVITTDRNVGTSVYVQAKIRCLCAYNGDTPVPEAGSNDELNSYTVPSGVTSVVVTQASFTTYTNQRVIRTRETEQTILWVKQNRIGGFHLKGDLSAGQEFVFPIQNVKNHKVMSFSGNITTFSSIVLGRNLNGTVKESVSVDGTNIVITNTYGAETTVAHGLTISENIQILIVSSERNRLSKIRITSDGNSFEYTALQNITWNGDMGYPFVKSVGSTLTDCTASWNARNIDQPIWLFGDSYMTYDSARWVYYLIQDGFDKNCLMNAYAGENSQNAKIAFDNLLEYGRPKYIVWALGMNDGDNANDNAPNESWQTVINAVIDKCEEKGIIPILCTIPTTPTVNNNFKNTWVKSSGYRYIDFASGVGADSDGDWFDNMLSTDRVHPTEQGAKALYYKLLSELPEIVCY